MPNAAHATKIATCCYCGTRAALVLRGKDLHELSCRSCGAPLHDLKKLPTAASAHHRENPRLPAMAKPKKPARRDKPNKAYAPDRPIKKTAKKRRKSTTRWLMEEAFDFIEDIFD